MKRNANEPLHIATIGRCVGLRGDLKLHLHTDFPQQFKPGTTFATDRKGDVTIHAYDHDKGLVQFVGYQDRESAAKLTNQRLYTTMARTLEECPLEAGQYYWFELEGATVEEAGLPLGVVSEIERIADTDYLVVRTDAALVAEGASGRFYIPYIPRYVLAFEKESRKVITEGARDILEAS